MGHVTANDMIQGRRLPGWRTAAAVLRALDVEPGSFHELWLRAATKGAVERAESSGYARAGVPMAEDIAAIRALLERLVEILERRGPHGV